MATFSSLSLGSRKDADQWRKGMTQKLGYSEEQWVKKPEPSMAEYEAFFGAKNDWIFIAGHFGENRKKWGGWPYAGQTRLYNDLDNNIDTTPSTEVLFRKDHVLLRKLVSGSWSEKTLSKGSGFNQHKNCKLVLWGDAMFAGVLHR